MLWLHLLPPPPKRFSNTMGKSRDGDRHTAQKSQRVGDSRRQVDRSRPEQHQWGVVCRGTGRGDSALTLPLIWASTSGKKKRSE